MELRSCAGVLLATLALIGCTSFRLEVEAVTPVDSAYVLVGSKADLEMKNEADLFELVTPDRLAGYPYHAQLLLREETWELRERDGWPLDPKVKGSRFSLKIGKRLFAPQPGLQVAVLVQFPDGTWKWQRTVLVAKGKAQFTIAPSMVVPRDVGG